MLCRKHQSDSSEKERMFKNKLTIGAPLLAIVIQEDKTFTGSEVYFDRIALAKSPRCVDASIVLI